MILIFLKFQFFQDHFLKMVSKGVTQGKMAIIESFSTCLLFYRGWYALKKRCKKYCLNSFTQPNFSYLKIQNLNFEHYPKFTCFFWIYILAFKSEYIDLVKLWFFPKCFFFLIKNFHINNLEMTYRKIKNWEWYWRGFCLNSFCVNVIE